MMVERIVAYVPEAETVLNLTDGSFIDPEIAQQWVDLMKSRYRAQFTKFYGRKVETYMVDGMTSEVRKIVNEVAQECVPKSVWVETDVALTGDFYQELLSEDAGVQLKLQSFAPNFYLDDEESAQQVEVQNYQEQAFVSYRLAEDMIRTVKQLEQFQI